MPTILYIPKKIQTTPTIEYGLLYNALAVDDVRNIANVGWKVPGDGPYEAPLEWNTLINFISTDGPGGYMQSAKNLKDTSTLYWNFSGGINYYGFSGRGCGGRSGLTGSFLSIKGQVLYWTTRISSGNHYVWGLLYHQDYMAYLTNADKNGNTIRLVKESTTLTHGQTGIYTGNDGTVYPTICIGTQEWMAADLAETKYRNGDWIHGYDGGVYTPISNGDWTTQTQGALCAYNNDWDNV